MRGPRKIEDFVGFSCGDRLRFEEWFDDRVSRDGLAVVVADRAEAADQCRRGAPPGGGQEPPPPGLLRPPHTGLPPHQLPPPPSHTDRPPPPGNHPPAPH